MSAHAYIFAEAHGVSFDMGKFVGMWIDLDLSRCTVEEMQRRVRAVWVDPDETGRMLAFTRGYERIYFSDADMKKRELYAADLGALVWRFCEAHAWSVEMVDEDYFFDHGLERKVIGSRWPHRKLGLGFDLPLAGSEYTTETDA